jgi:hypothetical protein
LKGVYQRHIIIVIIAVWHRQQQSSTHRGLTQSLVQQVSIIGFFSASIRRFQW